MVGDKACLFFFANRDIPKDQEILYDYMDRSPESMALCPWLKARDEVTAAAMGTAKAVNNSKKTKKSGKKTKKK